MLDGRASDPSPEAGVSESGREATVLAFDYGARWTGVAVGEHESGLAHPLTVIEARSDADRIAAAGAFIETWRPSHLVVGLPLTLSGGEHRLGAAVRKFAAVLGDRFRLPVIFVDERLSSAEAESALRESGRGGRAHKHLTHQMAAQRILQDYFDDRSAARR
jgi:putative Holliday junction resolvase